VSKAKVNNKKVDTLWIIIIKYSLMNASIFIAHLLYIYRHLINFL